MAILSNTIATTLSYKTLGQSSAGTAGGGNGKTTIVNPTKLYRHTFVFWRSTSYTPSSATGTCLLSLSFDIYTTTASAITTATTETTATSTMITAIKTKLSALGASTTSRIPASGALMYGYNSACPIIAVTIYSTSGNYFTVYYPNTSTIYLSNVSISLTASLKLQEIITPVPAANL